jgi:hypothetical protein
MNVVFALVCDYANLSQDGKVNIMGVFGEINPPVLPLVIPQMYLVVNYLAGPGEFGHAKDSRIVLTKSDGEEVLVVEQTFNIPKPPRPGSKSLVGQIIGFAGVVFDVAGDYAFSIQVAGDEKGSVPLHVNPPPGVSQ